MRPVRRAAVAEVLSGAAEAAAEVLSEAAVAAEVHARADKIVKKFNKGRSAFKRSAPI